MTMYRWSPDLSLGAEDEDSQMASPVSGELGKGAYRSKIYRQPGKPAEQPGTRAVRPRAFDGTGIVTEAMPWQELLAINKEKKTLANN